jgi:hypothetical protein
LLGIARRCRGADSDRLGRRGRQQCQIEVVRVLAVAGVGRFRQADCLADGLVDLFLE